MNLPLSLTESAVQITSRISVAWQLFIPLFMTPIHTIAPIYPAPSFRDVYGIGEHTPITTGSSATVIQQSSFSHRVIKPLVIGPSLDRVDPATVELLLNPTLMHARIMLVASLPNNLFKCKKLSKFLSATLLSNVNLPA